MTRFTKRITAVFLSAVCAFSLFSCAKETSPFTEEEYLAKAVSLYAKADELFNVEHEQWDEEEAVAKNKEIVEQVRPYYEELANLDAPKKYDKKQLVIKEGADATMELLDLMMEINELCLDENASEEYVAERRQHISDRSSELNDVVVEFGKIMKEYNEKAPSADSAS